jgi:hypothetical protein
LTHNCSAFTAELRPRARAFVALEALRDGWLKGKFTIDDLRRHATGGRVASVLRSYIEAIKELRGVDPGTAQTSHRHIEAGFNLTLTQYGLERLLYRLSISEHAQNFVLKGALQFRSGMASRTARRVTQTMLGSGLTTSPRWSASFAPSA